MIQLSLYVFLFVQGTYSDEIKEWPGVWLEYGLGIFCGVAHLSHKYNTNAELNIINDLFRITLLPNSARSA